MKRRPSIHIDASEGGINLYVPIEYGACDTRGYQELLIRAQQALITYLAALATEPLPVIV